MSFTELGVSARVSDALAARGIREPFPIQSLVMADALAGCDVWAKSPTGSGKTLAFAIPIVDRVSVKRDRPQALVLVPTRELAVQVSAELASIRGRLRVAVAYGGVSLHGQARAASRAHVIVATPGRLTDLLDRGAVSVQDIGILVLDEADRMLDMGFAPQVERIVRQIRAERQTLLFSATLDGDVAKLARSYTRDARVHEVASPKPTVELAEHQFVGVRHEDKLDRLVGLLSEYRGRALVFVRTKHGAARLAKRLSGLGVNAGAIHGDLSQGQRERALAAFSSGRSDTLIATDVASRGLDVDDITHVVNFDVPADDKTYVHRVGRTARAGRRGMGITFVTPDEVSDIRGMAGRLKLSDDFERAGFGTVRRADGPPRTPGRARSRTDGHRRRATRRA